MIRWRPCVVLAACVATLAVATFSRAADGPSSDWRPLFNGRDLTGWDTYLGPQYSKAKGDFDGPPVGLNIDPRHVFTVADVDGEPAIHISGSEFGGLSTVEEFANYHLRLEFKWGERKYPPKDQYVRDSGVLYHAGGPHGVDWFFWMKSQELQLQEGDCGDYWGCGSDADARVKRGPENTFTWDPKGELLNFGASPGKLNRNVKRSQNAEKTAGQWNTIELYSVRGDSLHVVNGVVVMELHNSRQVVNGKDQPLVNGKIQLQSEGAEVYYRKIEVEPIAELPKELVKE